MGSNFIINKRHWAGNGTRLYSELTKKDILQDLSKQKCKEIKIEFFKKGFVAVFEDMSLMKHEDYYTRSKNSMHYFNIESFKGKPGIYMITNKVNKKFYIGMSKNLTARFKMYFNNNVLELNQASRINRAILKHGLDKFSMTILELPNIMGTNATFKFKKIKSYYKVSDKEGENWLSTKLRNREAFFIKVFKPQYNIKRDLAVRDEEFLKDRKKKYIIDVPKKIRNLLDKCLDPN